MKLNRSSILSAAVVLGFVALSAQKAFSQDDNYGNEGRHEGRGRHGRHEFMMGVCVGQTLAAQGVTLPAHQPGVRPSPNPATQAAFKAAIESCKAQFHGEPSGTPSASAPEAPTS